MTLAPWEYMFYAFNAFNFPDLFWPTVYASIAALIATVVLYNVRTRQLHRHRPYLDLWEWLLWTGLVTFSLLLVGARGDVVLDAGVGGPGLVFRHGDTW